MQLKAIIALFKVRLSLTVVISSVLCYFIALKFNSLSLEWPTLLSLFFGGCFITFGANAFNQILEKEQDGIMVRTKNRPLAKNLLSLSQATIIAIGITLLGFLMLYFGTKPIAGVIGLLSFVLYAFVYTPAKSITNFNVFIGAIPGALPPLIGYLAATGEFDLLGLYLFTFQFIWQFPHFWAIAWMLEEDYKSVNYKMLPSKKGKTKITAFIILIYTCISSLIATLPFFVDLMNIYGLISVILLGIYFIWCAVQLLVKMDNIAAKKLMFASLLFMPLIYIILLL